MEKTLDDFDPELVDELNDNVQRGIALLDHESPGWAAHVDADKLVMSDCVFCVLGQLAPRWFPENDSAVYAEGCRFLFGELAPDHGVNATRHGFSTRHESGISEGRRFAILTLLWRRTILNRQRAISQEQTS